MSAQELKEMLVYVAVFVVAWFVVAVATGKLLKYRRRQLEAAALRAVSGFTVRKHSHHAERRKQHERGNVALHCGRRRGEPNHTF